MVRTRAFALAALGALSTAAPAQPAEAGSFSWPNVPERIERGLGSADVTERRAVARRLVDAPSEVAAPLIRRALGDPDVEVRLAAASAAVAVGLPAGGDLVVPWIGETDVRLRLAACHVVRAAPTRTSVAALGRALADASADVRGAAATALGASGYADAVSPLLGHVDDASPEVRVEVVRAIGRLRDVRAVLPLVGRLQDASPEVRRAAARSLREIGDPRASSALVVALTDTSTPVQLEVVETLGALRAPEAVLALGPLALGGSASSPSSTGAQAPRGESADVLRAAALRALARIPEPRAVAAMVAALPLDDPDADLVARSAVKPTRSTRSAARRVALGAAGALSQPPWGAALGSATPAGDALVAAGARAVPALLDVLRTSAGPRALSSAARALATLDGALAVPAIGKAMLGGRLPVRPGLQALAQTGRSEALPMVLERLDDAEPLVREAALEAALALVDPGHPDGRLVDPVVATLRDPRRTLGERVGLVRLLGRSGSPRAAAPLLALLRSNARPVPAVVARPTKGTDDARRIPLQVASLEALGGLGVPSAASDAILLEALSDEAPSVRRAASAALGRAGSAAAAVELTRRLVEAAEDDRGAIAVALSGVASRARSEATGEVLAEAAPRAPLDVRDGILEALGRAKGDAARVALIAASASPDIDERRKVAESLAGHGGQPEVQTALRKLAADADATVRAAAVWSLGSVGDASDRVLLEKHFADPDGTVSGNAVASFARIATRATSDAADGPAALCRVVDDPRAYVGVNALVGLSFSAAACDVARVGALLSARRPAVVRAAAARYLAGRASSPADAKAVAELLARCAAEERDAEVAKLCTVDEPTASAPPEATAGVGELLVFVVPDGGTAPRSRAPYALVRPDGFVHLGVADRRGAVLERELGAGDLRLEVPAPLVR